MKRLIFTIATLVALSGAISAATPTAMDLVGKWDGAVEFGKFNFKLILRVAKTPEGRLAVTMDNPDQGQKGMAISALLFNNPDVRIEIDQFGTAYAGKLSADSSRITGAFEEGPGGRPIPVEFKRSTEPDLPEPERVFTFKPGEAQDIRGYWKGPLELGPGMTSTVGLNIGRLPDGTFRAALDLPEQGAKDIPATSVIMTNGAALLKWNAFQSQLTAKLSEDGKELAGEWKGRGPAAAVKFSRLDAPYTLSAKNLSYDPEKTVAQDARGYWKGTLDVPGGHLRLVFKVGKGPDGSYGASMISLDQGGVELPASGASFATPKVEMEWKGIRGKYTGEVSQDGASMDGKWEQFGNPTPLKLERISAADAEKKS